MIFILTVIATLVHFLIKWQWRSLLGVMSIIPGGLSLAGLDMYADNIVLFLLSLAFLLLNLVLLFTPDRNR
ncbi:conserved hypothetical protein [Vibrio chagasii]|nr:conserved hypothetical protein [Vibrio chagasii]